VREQGSGGIEHRLARPDHPWSLEDQTTAQGTVVPTSGHVGRTNRTIGDGEAGRTTIRGIAFPLTATRFQSGRHEQLRTHLADLMAACTFARRPKTPGGLPPRTHLHDLDFRARSTHSGPDPLEAGTEHADKRAAHFLSSALSCKTASI
jgi:hypothetical protein